MQNAAAQLRPQTYGSPPMDCSPPQPNSLVGASNGILSSLTNAHAVIDRIMQAIHGPAPADGCKATANLPPLMHTLQDSQASAANLVERLDKLLATITPDG